MQEEPLQEEPLQEEPGQEEPALEEPAQEEQQSAFPSFYTFSADKWADGIVLSGNVPSPDVRSILVEQASGATTGSVKDQLKINEAAPNGFAEMAVSSMAQLINLESGELDIFEKTISLKGEVPTQTALEVVRSAFDSLPDDVTLGNFSLSVSPAVPYVFELRRQGDNNAVIEGNVPSRENKEDIFDELAKLGFDAVTDATTIKPGNPPAFNEVGPFAANIIKQFDRGGVSFVDEEVRINGRAKDVRAFEKAVTLAENLPDGFRLVENKIDLPLVSPYRFSAVKVDNMISYNGVVSSQDALSQLLKAAQDQDWTVDNNLSLAAGAPDGFADFIPFATKLLGHLKEGSVRLQDQEIEVEGSARSTDAYNLVIADIKNPPQGLSVISSDIERQLVFPYVWSAKRDGASIELLGFVPDAATNEQITDSVSNFFPDAVVSDNMDLAAGEPAQIVWSDATRFALDILTYLDPGKVSFKDDILTVEGTPLSEESLGLMRFFLIDKSTPSGVIVKDLISGWPLITPYTFDAVKGDEVTLSGFAPRESARIKINIVANQVFGGALSSVELPLGSGAPDDYSSAVVRGLQALAALESGAFNVEDRTATLSGLVPDDASISDVQSQFEKALPEGFTAIARLTQREVEAKPPVEPLTPQQCSDAILAKISESKILFETDRAGILSNSFALLDDIAANLLRCPAARFEIAGHTDSDGNRSFNQRLSEARALSVLNYLVAAGVPEEQLKAFGYGETRPLVVNTTAQNKALNRRIEFNLQAAN